MDESLTEKLKTVLTAKLINQTSPATAANHFNHSKTEQDMLKFRIPLKLDQLCVMNSEHLKEVIEEIIKTLNRYQFSITSQSQSVFKCTSTLSDIKKEFKETKDKLAECLNVLIQHEEKLYNNSSQIENISLNSQLMKRQFGGVQSNQEDFEEQTKHIVQRIEDLEKSQDINDKVVSQFDGYNINKISSTKNQENDQRITAIEAIIKQLLLNKDLQNINNQEKEQYDNKENFQIQQLKDQMAQLQNQIDLLNIKTNDNIPIEKEPALINETMKMTQSVEQALYQIQLKIKEQQLLNQQILKNKSIMEQVQNSMDKHNSAIQEHDLKISKIIQQLQAFEDQSLMQKQINDQTVSRIKDLNSMINQLSKQAPQVPLQQQSKQQKQLSFTQASTQNQNNDQVNLQQLQQEIQNLKEDMSTIKLKSIANKRYSDQNSSQVNTPKNQQANENNLIDHNTLAALEKQIINKVNNMLLLFNEKYANKDDFQRNLSLVENNTSLKISPRGTSNYFGRDDSDDAMLSRKPLGQMSCASCDRDIVNLYQKQNQFEIWNKMPFRNPGDRIAKVGPGFSKMLAMVSPYNSHNQSLNNINSSFTNVGNAQNLSSSLGATQYIRNKSQMRNSQNSTQYKSLTKVPQIFNAHTYEKLFTKQIDPIDKINEISSNTRRDTSRNKYSHQQSQQIVSKNRKEQLLVLPKKKNGKLIGIRTANNSDDEVAANSNLIKIKGDHEDLPFISGQRNAGINQSYQQ
eukprot:403333413